MGEVWENSVADPDQIYKNQSPEEISFLQLKLYTSSIGPSVPQISQVCKYQIHQNEVQLIIYSITMFNTSMEAEATFGSIL